MEGRFVCIHLQCVIWRERESDWWGFPWHATVAWSWGQLGLERRQVMGRYWGGVWSFCKIKEGQRHCQRCLQTLPISCTKYSGLTDTENWRGMNIRTRVRDRKKCRDQRSLGIFFRKNLKRKKWWNYWNLFNFNFFNQKWWTFYPTVCTAHSSLAKIILTANKSNIGQQQINASFLFPDSRIDCQYYTHTLFKIFCHFLPLQYIVARIIRRLPSQDHGIPRAADKHEALSRRPSRPLTRSRPLARSSLSSPAHMHARRARVRLQIWCVYLSWEWLCLWILGLWICLFIHFWLNITSGCFSQTASVLYSNPPRVDSRPLEARLIDKKKCRSVFFAFRSFSHCVIVDS